MCHEDDYKLLRLYAEHGSQDAFSQLVERHLRLVYSVCLRETGNPCLAEDATQAVFLILAQKAGSMGQGLVLAGWLFTTARFTSWKALRGERRRKIIEEKAVGEMARSMHHAEEDVWSEVEPHLHQALAKLKSQEREAILLRFFQEKSYKEVGAAQGIAENNARMRVSRALEKLRSHLARAGVAVSATVLGELMLGRAAHAVPATCTAKVALVISCLASSAPASLGAGTSAYQLSRGVLKAMFVSKMKVVAVTVAVVCICAAGRKAIRLAVADDGSAAAVPASMVPVDQSTPEGTILTYEQAMNRFDIEAASKCVVGGLPASELIPVRNREQARKSAFKLEISGISAQADGDDTQLTTQEFNIHSANDPQQSMSFGPQVVPLRRQDGAWKIVPGDSSYGLPQKAAPNALQLLASQLTQSVSPVVCTSNLKQIDLAAIQLSLDYNDAFAFDAATAVDKIKPYLRDQNVWHCPGDSSDKPSYSFNGNLANVSTKAIGDPANTVLFYEGHDGKLDFRHNGSAEVAFADGHVKQITQSEAASLNWNP